MPAIRKTLCFWPVATAVFLSDCATKAMAEHHLPPASPQEVLGEFLRLTLVYNQSAAMSLDLGRFSRPLLSLVSTSALIGIWWWYRRLRPEAASSIVALALIWAGAAGNLWDRIRAERGVVDFIDVGLGPSRFWVFNLADVAITFGAIWLALSTARLGTDHDRGASVLQDPDAEQGL